MTMQDRIDGEILAYEIVDFVRGRTGSPQTFLAALQFLDGWRALKEVPRQPKIGFWPKPANEPPLAAQAYTPTLADM